jgi:hypothetical protein
MKASGPQRGAPQHAPPRTRTKSPPTHLPAGFLPALYHGNGLAKQAICNQFVISLLPGSHLPLYPLGRVDASGDCDELFLPGPIVPQKWSRKVGSLWSVCSQKVGNAWRVRIDSAEGV